MDLSSNGLTTQENQNPQAKYVNPLINKHKNKHVINPNIFLVTQLKKGMFPLMK